MSTPMNVDTSTIHGDRATDEGRGGNPLVLWATTLWRYRWLVVLAVLLGGVVGVFRAVTAPNQYRSMGKLFVRPGARDLINTEAAFSGAEGAAARVAGTRESVQNALQVLSSPKLFDKVVAHVGADVLLAPYEPPADGAGWSTRAIHAFQSWWFGGGGGGARPANDAEARRDAANMLNTSVTFLPDPGASVITVIYFAHSPELARTVVDAVLLAATQVHGDVFAAMSSGAAIEREKNTAETQSREADKALREFREKNEIYDYETQRDGLLAQALDIEQKIDAVALELQQTTAELEEVQALANSTKETREVRAAPTLNPNFAALTSYLLDLQRDLRQLDVRPQSNVVDPEFVTKTRKLMVDEIKELKDRIANEGPQLKLEPVYEENPHFIRLREQMNQLRVDLNGLESRKTVLENQRGVTKTRLFKLEQVAPQLQDLEYDARNKRKTADTLLAGVESLKAVERLEKMNFSSLNVFYDATLEPQRVSPSRTRIVVMAAIVGGVIGLGIAFLLSLRDRRVRGHEELLLAGVPADGFVRSETSLALDAGIGLPAAFAPLRRDIARQWTTISYDRRGQGALRIAMVPCGAEADAGKAAAALAIGLAFHGGERVALVAGGGDPTWFAKHAGLTGQLGWRDVLAGRCSLAAAVQSTQIQGLHYLAHGVGEHGEGHGLGSGDFLALLDRLGSDHRFVVVVLPDLESIPEGHSVLAAVEGVHLVAREGGSTKASVRFALAAASRSGARVLGAVLQPALGEEPASPATT